MQNLTLQKVHTAFQIYPQQAQALICRGVLPDHPRGQVSKEYVLALGKYYLKRERPLTPEADLLLKSVRGEADGK